MVNSKARDTTKEVAGTQVKDTTANSPEGMRIEARAMVEATTVGKATEGDRMAGGCGLCLRLRQVLAWWS